MATRELRCASAHFELLEQPLREWRSAKKDELCKMKHKGGSFGPDTALRAP